MATQRGRGLEDEPFFSAVRARHPDIDIVVLPPERSAAEPEEPTVSADEARRRRAELEDSLHDLWPLLATGLQPDPESWLAGWRGVDGTGVEAQASLRAPEVTEGEALAALDAAAANLLSRAWRVTEPRAGARRVVGQKDGLTVEVTWWSPVQAYDVMIRTEPLAVGTEVSRELKAADRR